MPIPSTTSSLAAAEQQQLRQFLQYQAQQALAPVDDWAHLHPSQFLTNDVDIVGDDAIIDTAGYVSAKSLGGDGGHGKYGENGYDAMFSVTSDIYSSPIVSPEPLTTCKRPSSELFDDLFANSFQANKREKKSSTSTSASDDYGMQAQYPILSSEIVDGFFSGGLNISDGTVSGGFDEFNLSFPAKLPSPTPVIVYNDMPTVVVPEAEKPLPLASSDEMATQITRNQNQPNSLTPQSQPQSPPSVSVPVLQSLDTNQYQYDVTNLDDDDDDVVDANDSDAADDALSGHRASGGMDGNRRAKRRLTDKQRRAKIKDGLEHLRSLVSLHGNASGDQASIVQSSVELLQQLVNQSQSLKVELARVKEEGLQLAAQIQAQHQQQQQQQQQQQSLPVVQSKAVRALQSMAQAVSNSSALSDEATGLSQLIQSLSAVTAKHSHAGNNYYQLPQYTAPSPQPQSMALSPQLSPPLPEVTLDNLTLSSYLLQTIQLLNQLPPTRC